MGRPTRNEVFSASEVGIVHIVQRCVRRAWLAGFDQVTGKDYSFRREWIRRRMEALDSILAVDILRYAILSNHLHLILRNRPDVVAKWSDEEVALRWLRVFPGRQLDEQLAEPTENDVQTLAGNAERIAEIRPRLSDISWFMRALSEQIARMANQQDEVTGRFWYGTIRDTSAKAHVLVALSRCPRTRRSWARDFIMVSAASASALLTQPVDCQVIVTGCWTEADRSTIIVAPFCLQNLRCPRYAGGARDRPKQRLALLYG